MDGAKKEEKKVAQSASTLLEDLRAPELNARINAFKNLKVICDALGEVRTRDEFIPYLTEFTDEDDEVLGILSEELGGLITAVGGGSHAHCLLVPLESLAAVEDPNIRNKAVASAVLIFNATTTDSITKHGVPFLKRLATAEYFPGREAACQLFHVMYPRVASASKKELRGLFVTLCADPTPVVRRAAAKNIGKLVGEADFKEVKSDLFTPFLKLSEDDQDSVRLLVVEPTVEFAKAFRQADHGPEILPVIHKLCKDKSWRVRYVVADKICELWQAIGESKAKDKDSDSMDVEKPKKDPKPKEETKDKKTKDGDPESLIDGFVGLLQDSEAEVRTAAAFKIGDVAKLVGAEVTTTKLLAPVKVLTKDISQYTRAALGSVIMSIASVIGKTQVESHLLPLFLQLLKDTHPEVRLNIIAKLESVGQVISVEQLTASLLPAISELATDKKWRVRLSIIRYIPLLAKQLGAHVFESKLNDLCMSWLSDSVYSIRAAATTNLTKIAHVFGAPWATTHIIPRVAGLVEHKSYLYRMTALYAITDMSRGFSPEVVTEKLLPLVLQLLRDPVPNVRFNVCRALGTMSGYVANPTINKEILPSLEALHRDTDSDVQQYASQALAAARSALEGKRVTLTHARSSPLDADSPFYEPQLDSTYLSSFSAPLSAPRRMEDDDHEMAMVDGLPTHRSGGGGGGGGGGAKPPKS